MWLYIQRLASSVWLYIQRLASSVWLYIQRLASSVWLYIQRLASSVWLYIQRLASSVWLYIQRLASSVWLYIQRLASSVWLYIQRLEVLSGTGSSARPPWLSHSSWALVRAGRVTDFIPGSNMGEQGTLAFCRIPLPPLRRGDTAHAENSCPPLLRTQSYQDHNGYLFSLKQVRIWLFVFYLLSRTFSRISSSSFFQLHFLLFSLLMYLGFYPLPPPPTSPPNTHTSGSCKTKFGTNQLIPS